jgi:predicted  nucleic acid-binding Zn-ribbon protein
MRWLAIFLVTVSLIGLFLIDTSAQRRRRRRARRSTPQITNPTIYQPATTDEMNANSNSSTDEGATTPSTEQNPEEMKKTIRTLSTQVDALTNKINQMGDSQRQLVDLERLSRAEQRSASLWKELREVETQQADLQARAEEISYAMKPENIERSVAGYGTTRPEELREQRRKQLENEKARIDKQLEQLAANHTRLEQAVAGADAEVERLRKRLDAAEQADLENAKTRTQSEGATPAATPTPTPYR